MADEQRQPNESETRDQTKPEPVEQRNQQESPSQKITMARPDQSAPRGRRPLFGI
jgi:hypothetical protein